MSLSPVPPNASPSSAATPLWPTQLGLVVCIFIACWVGALSRPAGYLAAIWPANAVMLGILLRHPALGKLPLIWLYALLTFIGFDLLSGATGFVAFNLSVANVMGVCGAWLYLHRQSTDALRLRHPRSVEVLFLGCLIGALCCAVPGAWTSSIAFDVPLWQSLVLWLSGEFFGYILLTPLFMAAPKGWCWTWPLPWQQATQRLRARLLYPLLALMVCEVLSLVLGGPGAIAFLIPALVWCAMTYRVFSVTVLTALVCLGQTIAMTLGDYSFTPDHVMEAISYRTGLALLSLAPLAVACAYLLRQQALSKLQEALNHDFLTGALMEQGQASLARLQAEGQPLAVLMVDLDHFKQINDRYGHAQGDLVLQEFARMARQTLRADDLLGRLGGEEFAIVLLRTSHEQALATSLRLCGLMRAHAFATEGQSSMHITISIGLHAAASLEPSDTLEHLLAKADQALYMAKRKGRNQVHPCAPALAPSAI